jgi:hypothetical protein
MDKRYQELGLLFTRTFSASRKGDKYSIEVSMRSKILFLTYPSDL